MKNFLSRLGREIRENPVEYLILAFALVLFPYLRLRQCGHLLTWDEAMNICSVKAFVSLGEDDFSNWFWRHPPLYTTALTLLAPLRAGFVQRAELFNIGLGLLNLLLLFLLNRKVLGIATAACSAFLLAIMPGSVFFDLWIKRDHLAVTFGLLSLLFVWNRRYAASSLMAGLGVLAKTTFAFLYIPIGLSFLLLKSKKCSLLWRLIMIILIPLLASGWWFLIASRGGGLSSIGTLWQFVFQEGGGWEGGPFYYVRLVGELVGHIGVLLLFGGILTAIIHRTTNRFATLIWPIAPIVLPLLLLSLLPRKVPWVIIVLLPCFATAQGIALSGLLRANALVRRRLLTVILAVLSCVLLALPMLRYSHNVMLASVSPDQHRGSTRSRTIAGAASNLITDDDRVLLSSFHYWKGLAPGQMCPVFTCYFEPDPAIMSVPHNAPFELIVQLISDHDLNWAIVSPEPGAAERDVLGGFIQDAKLTPANTGYACIFDTSSLLAEPESGVRDEIPESSE